MQFIMNDKIRYYDAFMRLVGRKTLCVKSLDI